MATNHVTPQVPPKASVPRPKLPPKLQQDLTKTGQDVGSIGKTVANLGTDLFTGKSPTADAKTLGQNIQALQGDKQKLQADLNSLPVSSPLRQAVQNLIADGGNTITAGQQFLKGPTTQTWQSLLQDGQKLTPDMQKLFGASGIGSNATQAAKDLTATGATVGKLASDLWSG
ncbi:MAG: hypothetical protein PHO89_05260, partial [Methylacidiphilaceae bacterium]|nr:hypothetical protein [Candidatus Methylacidiphilaceae bacterium]